MSQLKQSNHIFQKKNCLRFFYAFCMTSLVGKYFKNSLNEGVKYHLSSICFIFERFANAPQTHYMTSQLTDGITQYLGLNSNENKRRSRCYKVL